MKKLSQMKGFVIFCLVFAQLILCAGKKVQAEELSLYARSALLIDASNGRVLYEENGYQIMPMASTTKIMTCILAIEWMETISESNRNAPVVVSAYAARMPKVHLGMQQGEQYQLEDLLYSLMLESHNDTAVAIAEHIGGSVEEFAERMNQKAKELGCKDTYFITPNGLDAEKEGKVHSTTAYDMGLIASYAIKNQKFCDIIQTEEYQFSECSSKRVFHVYNTDRFLSMMDGAIGIKTGFTADAGYCFVGALEREGKKFVSVVLASGWPPNKNWKWADTKCLMEYGVEKYERKNIERQIDYGLISVVNGVDDKVPVAVEKKKERELVVLLAEDDKVSVKNTMVKALEAPVRKGTTVGYEYYFINDELLYCSEIKTTESVELRTYFYCLHQIFMLYF